MVKRTTNQMIALDIRQVHRAGGLVPGHLSSRAWTWSSGSVTRVFLDAGIDLVTLSYRRSTQGGRWQECVQRVPVEWTPCNYGGRRPWWICPGCGMRVAILYGGRKYACRHCHDLTYRSTRAAPQSKHFTRANKVRTRLGWGGGVASPIGDRPKGMHMKTYLRLVNELSRHGLAALPSTEKLVSQMTRVLDRFDLRGRS
jgi:hypothetical protein